MNRNPRNPRHTPFHPARRQRGVTLIESLIVTAITAVTLGAGLPGFEQARERRHLEGVAAQLETDIHFTRSLAVAHNRGLRIGFASGAEGSCYVVHTGAAQECRCTGRGETVCEGDAHALRTVHFDAQAPVQVRANVASMLFDPLKGTSTPTGTLRVTAATGHALHQVVNIMGRVRTCSPAPALIGYPAC